MEAIVYTTNTGNTARYAKMLAAAMDLPVFSSEEGKKRLSSGAEVIYLGWLMAGTVKGYKEAAKQYSICAVCAVGMGKTGTQKEEVRKKNGIPDQIPLFTLQGNLDVTKLRGIYKMMIRVMIQTAGKALAEKENRTPEEDDMLEALRSGEDHIREENLTEILGWYRGKENIS